MQVANDTWLAQRLSELAKNEEHMRTMGRPPHRSLENKGMELVARHALENERQCSDRLVQFMRQVGAGDSLSPDEQDHYVRALNTLVYCNGVSGVRRGDGAIGGFPLCPFDHAVKNMANEVRERYGIGEHSAFAQLSRGRQNDEPPDQENVD